MSGPLHPSDWEGKDALDRDRPTCICGVIMEPFGILDNYHCPVCGEDVFAETQEHFDTRIKGEIEQ